MNEPINLNKYRKAKTRAEGKISAAFNRVKHGLKKSDRKALLDAEERMRREIEAHRREDPKTEE